MKYYLYRNAEGKDAGNVIVGEHKDKEIDLFEVYRFTKGAPVMIEIFKGDEMEINSDGRPLWSEITWTPNKKWEQLNTTIDLAEIAKNLQEDESAWPTELMGYFGS